MFESIKHHFSDGSLTSASYVDGDVQGYISFSSDPQRTGIISAVGVDDAMRECSLTHWVGYRGRYRAMVREAVAYYA